MGDIRTIVNRVLGNDVDCPAYGRRAEKRRTATAHHLDTLNHVGRNLFKAIYAGQSREYRSRIKQNLRIMTVKAIDAHLRKTAVLTVILDAHARLETEAVSKTGRADKIKRRRAKHIYQR